MTPFLRSFLVPLLSVSALSAVAQPAAFDRGVAPQPQYNTGFPVFFRLQAPRPDVRLVAQSHYRLEPGASSLTLVDSSVCTYSGDRSGDPMTSLRFDTQISFFASGERLRSEQHFNPDNTVAAYLTQRWDPAAAAWTNLSRYSVGYSNGVRVSDSSWDWDAAGKCWTLAGCSFRQLDASGQPIVFTRFVWNRDQRRFDSGAQLLSRYDVAGNLVERLVRYGFGRLGLSSRSRYEYDARNRATAVRTDNWDAATQAWISGGVRQFTLDSLGDRILQTNLEPDGESGNFFATQAYSYKYDSRRNVTEMTGSGDRISYTYDALGRCTSMTRIPVGGSSVTESRRFYYAAPAAVGTVREASALKVWPVPASGVLCFSAATLGPGAYTAEIAAGDGRSRRSVQVRSAGSGSGQIEVGLLPPGVYILNLKTSGGAMLQSRFVIAQ